jgi:hypothetical protein
MQECSAIMVLQLVYTSARQQLQQLLTHVPAVPRLQHSCSPDRQTDGRTDRQTDRRTDRQTDRQAGRQAGRQADRQTD